MVLYLMFLYKTLLSRVCLLYRYNPTFIPTFKKQNLFAIGLLLLFNFRSIFSHSINATLTFIDQIAKGLELFGVLEQMKNRPEAAMALLCCNKDEDIMKWTFDKLQQRSLVTYSEQGSNQREVELNVYKAFVDSVEAICYDG